MIFLLNCGVAVFKQTHLDVQARLGNFAFGIVRIAL